MRQALNTHHVIFFRDQSLTPEQQADFARQFGTVTEAHPVLPSIDESPEVLAIDGRGRPGQLVAHRRDLPPDAGLGSILYMLEAPEVGGDTMWASLQDAYDGLADPVRAMCDTSIAIHYDPWFAADVDAIGWLRVGRRVAREAAARPPSRSCAPTPRTGATASSSTRSSPSRPRPLEEREQRHPRHALPPLPASRSSPAASAGGPVRWPSGTTGPRLHYALDDYGDAARIAHRVTLRGDVPYGPAMPLRRAPEEPRAVGRRRDRPRRVPQDQLDNRW